MMNEIETLSVEEIQTNDPIKCDHCGETIPAGADCYMVEDFIPETVGCTEKHAIEAAVFCLRESAEAARFEDMAYGVDNG